MLLNVIFPFATVLSAYGQGFDVFIGTEGGIAKYNLSYGGVEWKYPFGGRVEHVVFLNGNVVFYSGGKIYLLPQGSGPLSPAFEISSADNPKRMGVSSDGLIVLDYGNRYRVMDIGGIERENSPEVIFWGASWRDGSVYSDPRIKNLPLYHPILGKVEPLFLLSFDGRWYVGTDGLGMLVMNEGSLFPDDTVMEGTVNGEYRYMSLIGDSLYVAGDRGVDVLDGKGRFISIGGCGRGVDYLFFLRGGMYAAGCGRIYRIYEGISMDITGSIGYDRIKEAGGRIFIFYRGSLYEFDGRRVVLRIDRYAYDVFSLNGGIYAITDGGIVDVDRRSKLPITRGNWIDRFSRADSDGSRAAICTRFGVLFYDGRWHEFQNALGEILDCEISGDNVLVVSRDHLLRVLSLENGTWDIPFQNIGDMEGVEAIGDTLYLMGKRSIFQVLLDR